MSKEMDESHSVLHYKDTLFSILRKYRKNTAMECPQALEYLAKHPSVIAKDWWCYESTRAQRFHIPADVIIEIRVEIIKNYLSPYEIKNWQYKSFAIHPCSAKMCPYMWCCIRAHTGGIVTPDDSVCI